MLQKIINAAKIYFSMLNMTPGSAPPIFRKPAVDVPQAKPTPFWVHVLLFAITFVTTTASGVVMCAQSDDFIAEIPRVGIPYALAIMTILLAHELGHYYAAKRFDVATTRPFFIPFIPPVGTMGAVIRIKSKIHDKRTLLYIGAAGPMISFTLSLVATVVGLLLSEVKAFPAAPPGGELIELGDSIILLGLTRLIHGEIPPGFGMIISPLTWAGWIGFLVTSLNLMPIGQLDGSHILYALIGRRQVYAGWLAFAGLVALAVVWPGWIVWIALALIVLMIGHPPIEDGEPITIGERIAGWFCIVILIITFIPQPVNILPIK